MKILITGTAGFIGFHLAKRLLNEGYEVVGLDNINDYYAISLKYARLAESGITETNIEYGKLVKSDFFPNYRFVKMDLEDRERMEHFFKVERFDLVYHLAAQAGVRYSIENPYAYVQSNLVGFMNILECCRNNMIKHLIYASSSSVYGQNAKVPFSESDCTDYPVSLYAATKKANELMAHSYSHLYGIQTIGLRFFTVYGPWGRPDMAPFLFLDAILNDREIKIFNNGEMLRDFTFIDDIVEGLTKVLNNIQNSDISEKLHEVYNIGNSSPVQLMDFIDVIERVTGIIAKKTYMPMQAGDVFQTYSDMQKFENKFVFRPQIDIYKGMERFLEWYKSFYMKK